MQLNVPSFFLIAIEVFDGDGITYLPVRLTYRLVGGNVMWGYKLLRLPETIRALKKALFEDLRSELNLPAFYGELLPNNE